MKVSKVLHINDGQAKVLQNGNFMFVEEYSRAAEILNQYLADGWEMRAMVPEYHPGPGSGKGGPAFYCGGFTFYLEREEA